MGKFYGKVGYVETVVDEKDPGIWDNVETVKTYRGDILKKTSRWIDTEDRNDNVVINNSISIIADAFAYQKYPFIRFVEMNGARLEVTSIQVNRPRIILSVGGVYNG